MIRNKMVFGIALIVLVSIVYLSLSPKPAVTASNDKLGHFIAYSVLTFLMLRSFILQGVTRLIAIVVSCVLFGTAMEIGQLYVPGRSYSMYDMIANATGALMGLLVYYILRMFRSKYI
ncbi:MAG: hypothetical protein EP333_06495 [Bacteroidetes bacterium]|nr:MAG: hypothetical protein EP333_06495 [Bacteroidota bacterium]TNE96046.1 MAG: hypothetical protein EP322_08960 [Bacteroidota bacterium]